MAGFSFPGMTNAGYAVMGCHMNRSKALSLLPVLLLATLSLAACSGPKTGTICISNCGGTGTVSLTMVADTVPANPSLVTFKVTITGIALVTSGGTQQAHRDRKSTRLNSSHDQISYAVFCLKKKKKKQTHR